MKSIIQLPHIMSDNESRYLSLVLATVEYSNPGSNVRIHHHEGTYSISIQPQEKAFRQSLIDSLLGMHRALKLKIVYSSSLGMSNLVSFKVNLNLQDKK